MLLLRHQLNEVVRTNILGLLCRITRGFSTVLGAYNKGWKQAWF